MYQLGRTIRTTQEHPNGIPCIIYDDDSVLCEFPSIPNGEEKAKHVCEILNAAHEMAHE